MPLTSWVNNYVLIGIFKLAFLISFVPIYHPLSENVSIIVQEVIGTGYIQVSFSFPEIIDKYRIVSANEYLDDPDHH